ncbi:hypothetical protein L218DRAFT_4952 [Marasmius fiardii PR-910]|nr:hypothetical protein L218DRAFT_4952 [Marasmius fiardii PR-910]
MLPHTPQKKTSSRHPAGISNLPAPSEFHTPEKNPTLPPHAPSSTPRRLQTLTSDHVKTGNKRTQLASQVKRIPCIPIDKFFEPLRSRAGHDLQHRLTTVLDHLKHKRFLHPGYISDTGELQAFSSRTPSRMRKNERACFTPIQTLCEQTWSADPKNRPDSLYRLAVINKEITPQGMKDSLSRSDFYIVWEDTRTLKWCNTAVAAQFKTKFGKLQEALFDGRHILEEDPSRRFTFALTIADTTAHLIYFSPSCTVATPFDIKKEPHIFIEFLLCITTYPSTPKECFHALWLTGFQPLDHPIVHLTRGPQFCLRLNSHEYKTVSPLSNYKAGAVNGRLTRVWVVEDQTGNTGVMKQSNLPSGILEGDIYDQLLEDLSKEGEEAVVQNNFLTILGKSVVKHSEDMYIFQEVSQAMWKAGWVHRDLSYGNVYWHRTDRTVKFGDLEYGRRYEEGGSSQTKTGTPWFWSVEVASGLYRFDKSKSKSQHSLRSSRPFRHHALNELESLMWMGLWFILYHWPLSPDIDEGNMCSLFDQYFSPPGGRPCKD